MQKRAEWEGRAIERAHNAINVRCILLSSHYMDEAEAMGDRVYIMYEGKSVCSGTPLFLKDKCVFFSRAFLTIP